MAIKEENTITAENNKAKRTIPTTTLSMTRKRRSPPSSANNPPEDELLLLGHSATSHHHTRCSPTTTSIGRQQTTSRHHSFRGSGPISRSHSLHTTSFRGPSKSRSHSQHSRHNNSPSTIGGGRRTPMSRHSSLIQLRQHSMSNHSIAGIASFGHNASRHSIDSLQDDDLHDSSSDWGGDDDGDSDDDRLLNNPELPLVSNSGSNKKVSNSKKTLSSKALLFIGVVFVMSLPYLYLSSRTATTSGSTTVTTTGSSSSSWVLINSGGGGGGEGYKNSSSSSSQLLSGSSSTITPASVSASAAPPVVVITSTTTKLVQPAPPPASPEALIPGASKASSAQESLGEGASAAATSASPLPIRGGAKQPTAKQPIKPNKLRTIDTMMTMNSSITFPDTTSNCPSNLNDTNVQVTLVTQCSLDRLRIMEQTCQRWKDPIVVVLAKPVIALNSTNTNATAEQLQYFNESIISNTQSVCPHMNLIQYELSPQQSIPDQYPVNLLRNVGLDQVKTSHVLVVDVDFVPSQGLENVLKATLQKRNYLRETIAKPGSRYSQLNNIYPDNEEAFVVPAFERLLSAKENCTTYQQCQQLHYRTAGNNSSTTSSPSSSFLPSTFEELNTCFRSKPQLCAIFHESRVSYGHSTTKSKAWLRDGMQKLRHKNENNNNVRYIDCFESIKYEPYVVIRWCPSSASIQQENNEMVEAYSSAIDPNAPYYDERFVGYGYNKVEWVQHLRVSGRKFFVIPPRGFLIHSPHIDSKSRETFQKGKWTYGIEATDADELNAIENIAAAAAASTNNDVSGDNHHDSEDNYTTARSSREKMQYLYKKFFTKLLQVYKDKIPTNTPFCKARNHHKKKKKKKKISAKVVPQHELDLLAKAGLSKNTNVGT